MRNSRPNKTQSDDDNHHQRMGSQMHMMLIALPGEYASLLAKHNIVIAHYPSWEPIVFPPDTTLDHAAYLLAQAGLSVDKVGDASHFTLAWCQAMGALPHDDIQIRVRLGNAVITAPAHPGVNPWPPSMSHHWDITHARWVPTVPKVGKAMAVFAAPLIGGTGMVVPPPLPQIGTTGRRSPIPMGVPPATMVAGTSAPTTTSDDMVEIADTMSPPPAYAPPAD